MTPLIVAGVAAAAVLALAGGWLFVRSRRPARIASPEDAAAAAEGALAGFTVAGAVVGADGAGALAVAGDGRVAAVVRRGRALSVEEVAWRSLRATAEGMVVETERLGSVALAGVDVLDIRRLAPGYRVH